MKGFTQELYKFIKSKGGEISFQTGIVYVMFPDGSEWSFTRPTMGKWKIGDNIGRSRAKTPSTT